MDGSLVPTRDDRHNRKIAMCVIEDKGRGNTVLA